MVRQFTDHPNDYEVWAHYDAMEVPVLCLRGAESDLVLRETTEEMMRRGPGLRGLVRVVEVAGCGHAPALNVPEQIDWIAAFIDEHERAPSERPAQRATASRP
jgi:pimeloyl-ACP methyl ester carboxylesterase